MVRNDSPGPWRGDPAGSHSSVAIVMIAGLALASLVLCAMEWPSARIGMVVNIVVFIGLAAIRALV